MNLRAALLLVLVICASSLYGAERVRPAIVVGKKASEMERYAVRELQRYWYQLSGTLPEVRTGATGNANILFVVGTKDSNPQVGETVSVSPEDPGPQGYVLKTVAQDGKRVLVIAGSDEAGCLYGVYGLLEDHLGVRFYLGGDVLPERNPDLKIPDLDERKKPLASIRGFLPWTNFPQSATVYSWEDWKFIIDQMAKMRMNFLHIHNYNGQNNHNEMFHNFTYKGFMSRVWMPTVRKPHRWSCPPWDVSKYEFGAHELYADYDWGADCALHNEHLDNAQVFRKGASLFQKVIAYAHTRGVKMGLGLDINLIPKDYKTKVDDPAVAAARVDQIARDYPDLDFLLCFQSEQQRNAAAYAVWRKIFDGFYRGMKASSPRTRLAVAGWGLDPKPIATLPDDVICAPISRYSDKCVNGAIYGDREFWGCPWLERDGNSSQYYYPYNTHLSNTIKAWQDRAPNMKGLYCLTWRLTDAIDPKMWYISKAPWDAESKLTTSEAVYRDYAVHNYGAKAAAKTVPIINQNEPVGDLWGECQGTSGMNMLGKNLFHFQSLRIGQAEKSIDAGNVAAKHGWIRGGKLINRIVDGTWVEYKDVDFGEKAESIELSVAAGGHGGIIEIRLGSHEGDLLATGEVTNTGGWKSWVSKKVKIRPTSGKQDLSLVFRCYPLARDVEHNKALEQIETVDRCIKEAGDNMQRERLKWLRCRLAAARGHIALKHRFNSYKWDDLPGEFKPWVENFIYRVMDISSLGNIMSSQNRFVQIHYVGKMTKLRNAMQVKPPSRVRAKGTRRGAIITWRNEQDKMRGFHVYRDGKRVAGELLSAQTDTFKDRTGDRRVYSVSSVSAQGKESALSIPAHCEAGSADKTPPHIIVISPPTSAVIGRPVWITARVLDNRSIDNISVTLRHRTPGTERWDALPMKRRARSVFARVLPGSAVTGQGVEYYIEATDGDNMAVFPASAPQTALSLVGCPAADTPPAQPGLTAENGTLKWKPVDQAFWYRIYRSTEPKFECGPATFLTYVAAGTEKFKDVGEDLLGRPLKGKWYYCITAVARGDAEGQPSAAVEVVYPQGK